MSKILNNAGTEQLNIADVSKNYKTKNYNCEVKEDLSEMIIFFLEDLEKYNTENNRKMNHLEIQKSIDKFKNDYLSKDSYYSEKDKYEEITESDDYFSYLFEQN